MYIYLCVLIYNIILNIYLHVCIYMIAFFSKQVAHLFPSRC